MTAISDEVQQQLAKAPDIEVIVKISGQEPYILMKTGDNNGFARDMTELKAKAKDVMTFLVKAEYNLNMAAINQDGFIDMIKEIVAKPPTFDILDNTEPEQIEPLQNEKEVQES